MTDRPGSIGIDTADCAGKLDFHRVTLREHNEVNVASTGAARVKTWIPGREEYSEHF